MVIIAILTIAVYDHMTHSGISTIMITGCMCLLMSERHASFLCGAIGLCIEALINGSYNTALLALLSQIFHVATKAMYLQNIFRHTCNSLVHSRQL